MQGDLLAPQPVYVFSASMAGLICDATRRDVNYESVEEVIQLYGS